MRLKILGYYKSLSIRRTSPTFISFKKYSSEGTGWNDFGSVKQFETKWLSFFNNEAYDSFELQRGLNNCFSFDIVPTIPVLEAALRAARRLNDYGVAMRVFCGVREKCKNDKEYLSYVKYLQPIKEELGISAPEDLGRL